MTTITIPSGRRIPLAQYVAGWRAAKANAEALIAGWQFYPVADVHAAFRNHGG